MLRWWTRIDPWIAAGTGGMLLWLLITVWLRHENFLTAQYDLGNMDQVIWQTLHGNFFTMTSAITGLHESRLATHADFLLLLYTPFYALWQDPRILSILQVIFVVSGVWPLWSIARRHLPLWPARLISGAYLAYPPLLWAVTFDVHAVLLAAPLFLGAWWAIEVKKYRWYSLFIFLALLSKEEVGLVVGLLGLVLMFWKKAPRALAITTTMVGFAWTISIVSWAIPAARHDPGHFNIVLYSDFGQSYQEILTTFITKPWIPLGQMLSGDSLGYYSILLFPLGFLSILAWPILLIALPELFINLLSKAPELHSIFFQYTAVITPFVILSALFGWRWVLRRWPKSAPWLTAWFITSFAVGTACWSPLPLTRHRADAARVFLVSPYRADVALVKHMVSDQDALALTNTIAPHFTQRAYAWAFPLHLERADGAVVLLGGNYEVVHQQEVAAHVHRLQQDPAWELVYHRDQFYYFRRQVPADNRISISVR